MNIQDILKLINFLDKLVFDKRKENLTPVEKAILEAVFKNKKLDNIQINGYSNGYVKTTLAQKLWKLLSGVTGEKVKKNTVQIVIENLYQKKDMVRSHYEESSKFSDTNNSLSNDITDNKSYHDTSSKSADIDDYEQFNKGDYIDDQKITQTNFDHGWGTIPNMGDGFYNRITELTTLTEYINNNCRLIAITGMPGMGKTFLAAKFVNQIQTNFDYVLWRSISDYHNFNSFMDSITQFLPIEKAENNQISALIQCFVNHRCLLVIDGMETIFTDNSLAGCYQKGWKEYGKLLTEVGINNHISCLLLTSGEKPKEVGLLEGENSPVRSLVISGLTEEESAKILIDKGLNKSQYFATLIKLYSSNPLALKLVADIIKEVFAGNIVNYLQHSTIFSHEFSLLLSQLFNRLSPLEMSMIYWLAIYENSVNLAQFKNDYFPKESSEDLALAMQSLIRRSLIIISENSGNFTLQSEIKRYSLRRFTSQFSQDIYSVITRQQITQIGLVGSYDLQQSENPQKLTKLIYITLIKLLNKDDSINNHLNNLLSILQGKQSVLLGYSLKNIAYLLKEFESQ